MSKAEKSERNYKSTIATPIFPSTGIHELKNDNQLDFK